MEVDYKLNEVIILDFENKSLDNLQGSKIMQKKDRKRTVLLSLCSRGYSPKVYGFSKGLVINVLVTSLIVSTKHLTEAMCGRKGLL